VAGIERLQAWFSGRGFTSHRHATYAIGITDDGVQTFDYRGSVAQSVRGQVVVLHPDEPHDGRAGDDRGFGYRILYVRPELIAAAAEVLAGRGTSLPFAPEPVLTDPWLSAAVASAFHEDLEPLAVDGLSLALAAGLRRAESSPTISSASRTVDRPALARARALLDSRLDVVHSTELEAATGLSRFELARQFRVAFGTSPYRYSVARRLGAARLRLQRGTAVVDAGLATGFVDQAHFTRMFRAMYGHPPGRYVRLLAAGLPAVDPA
jgi:AraC-like DNA-binding protein